MNDEKFNSIHALNRAQLLDDSFNLARYDYLHFSTALNLLKYLRHETELVPLAAGFKAIEFMIESMDQQKFFDNLRDILLNIVDEIYVRINNSSLSVTPEDEDYHVLTKLHVNLFACKIGAKSCLKDATKKLFLFDFDLKQLHVNERPYLYCGTLGDDLASFNWVQLKAKILKANGNEQLYRDNQDEFSEIFHAFSGKIHFIFIFETSLKM